MISRERSFSALVRWRSRLHPTCEVDTRHRGFKSAAAAALAANGLGPEAFEELTLERGKLFVTDAHGRSLVVASDVMLWTMPTSSVALPEQFRFERFDGTARELSAAGFDGGFDARHFRVVDDLADVDVPVRLFRCRARMVVVVGPPGDAHYAMDLSTA